MKRMETVCMMGIGIVILVTVIAVSLLSIGPKDANARVGATEAALGEASAMEEARLADSVDYLPVSVFYGKKLPVTDFKTADGTGKNLSEYQGKKLILMFWGSWCGYCDKSLGNMAEYEAALAKREDYEFVLINKTDPDKGETIEKAQEYLNRKEIHRECLYDEGMRAYQAFGIKRIPTILVLDEKGYLRYMAAASMASKSEFEGMLRYVDSNGAADTEQFIRSHMTGADGGIYTNYINKKGNSPVGYDVLSESQGIMMEYAVISGNKMLFDQSFQFAWEHLYREGIYSWYVAEDGTRADANAFLDDLRIYEALKKADQLWGGYGDKAKELGDCILGCNGLDGYFSGFYDFNQKQGGTTIPLCYLNLTSIQNLCQETEGFEGNYQEAVHILQNGYINRQFPLYYSSYDRETKEYSRESMNTAEALLTLYYAVKAGVNRQESLDWLEQKVVSGTLGARYGTDGHVIEGFQYDSTAVYAIAALIGKEAGNAKLYTAARNRMEKYRVQDEGQWKGSFTDREDGSDIIAFDQLMPLLVYGSTNDVVFEN